MHFTYIHNHVLVIIRPWATDKAQDQTHPHDGANTDQRAKNISWLVASLETVNEWMLISDQSYIWRRFWPTALRCLPERVPVEPSARRTGWQEWCRSTARCWRRYWWSESSLDRCPADRNHPETPGTLNTHSQTSAIHILNKPHTIHTLPASLQILHCTLQYIQYIYRKRILHNAYCRPTLKTIHYKWEWNERVCKWANEWVK